MTRNMTTGLFEGGPLQLHDHFLFKSDLFLFKSPDGGRSPDFPAGGADTQRSFDLLGEMLGETDLLDPRGAAEDGSGPESIFGELSTALPAVTERIRADISDGDAPSTAISASAETQSSGDDTSATLATFALVNPDTGESAERVASKSSSIDPSTVDVQSMATQQTAEDASFAVQTSVALFSLTSQPVTASFQQGVGGYTGTFDTFIRERSPDKTYGTLAYVDADAADSSGVRIQGLLSFSGIFGTGAGQIPLGAVITSASVSFSVSDATRNPVTLNAMLQDWSAASTWTWNAFGNGIQTDGIEAAANPVASISSMPTGLQTIDVTASVQAWAAGAPNYGWVLSTGSDGFRIASSESGAAPVLNITYALPTGPVPGLTVLESGGGTTVAEGGAGDSFSVVLNAAPTSDVTIAVTTAGGSDLLLAPTSLTFTPQNWQTAQTVSLAAVDDAAVEVTESFAVTLTAASADSGYNGRAANVSVSVLDNDAPPTLNPAVVAVHDTTLWKAGDPSGYGSGDPSGIAYIPSLDRLFIVDSEHDESPYFSSVNLFAAKLDGTYLEAISMRAYTREPTGIGYNPNNGLMYVSDDDQRAIFVVDPQNPTARIGQIDLSPLGVTDAEDPIIDPQTGHIFFLDGVMRTLYEITDTGSLVRKTVLPNAIVDAEAMAFDTQADVFYIAGGATRGTIFQTDMNGNLLATINLLNDFTNPISDTKPRIKGLELAPSSDPNDGNKISLYAVDYGIDQVPDGRLFEIDLYHSWQVS